jgi:hypothetical protein
MIKFRADSLTGLGLSRGNIDRLVAGQPIQVNGKEIGLTDDILIFFGETEDDLQAMIQPMIGPETVQHIDPRLKAGHG